MTTKLLILLSTVFFLTSCGKDELSTEPDMPEKLVENYCALGASTATMNWQKLVATDLAINYKCYAVPGTRWAHLAESQIDYSTDGSNKACNRVMANQLLRLIKDNDENGYYPDLITILCGLNDAAYTTVKPILGDYTSAFKIDMGNITIESWFTDNQYKELRETVYGSTRFVLEKLIRKFPFSTIVVITPQQVNNGTYTYERVESINNVIKKVASRYSIQVLDAFAESGITDAGGLASQFLQEDKIHPNTAGERLLYLYTTKKLRNIYFPKH